ncbi:unspecified product [Leishmania tarentolae]|uniref:Unspecified product n=1 Tax=Leishmania tarentolae TaxID=5689 RepID=A0A640KIX5_LEITA|nr:unspecified product [Leishmania tarentolae]
MPALQNYVLCAASTALSSIASSSSRSPSMYASRASSSSLSDLSFVAHGFDAAWTKEAVVPPLACLCGPLVLLTARPLEKSLMFLRGGGVDFAEMECVPGVSSSAGAESTVASTKASSRRVSPSKNASRTSSSVLSARAAEGAGTTAFASVLGALAGGAPAEKERAGEAEDEGLLVVEDLEAGADAFATASRGTFERPVLEQQTSFSGKTCKHTPSSTVKTTANSSSSATCA